MEENQNLNNAGMKAVILGGNSATGRQIIRELSQNKAVQTITAIARNPLEEWETDDAIKKKIQIIKLANYDDLSSVKDQISAYNSFFCCLGSRVGKGKEEFHKVDFTYCVASAQLAKDAGIPNFCIVSSAGANPKSSFLYMKTKGLADEAIQKIGLDYCIIARPGFLQGRENDFRCGECFLKYFCCCFFWCCSMSITVPDMSKAVVNCAINYYESVCSGGNQKKIMGNVVLENKDLVKLSKE